MISDTAVCGDVPCRVTGYFDRDNKNFLMVVYKRANEDAEIPFDLSFFTDNRAHTWKVTDEGGSTVRDGEMTEKGIVTVPGAAGKLYMVEIKAK